MNNIDPHKFSGPLEDYEKKQHMRSGNKNSKLIILVALGLALFVGGIIAYFTALDIEGAESAKESATSFIPFLPVWIAIFIPFFVIKNKKTTQDKRKILLIVGAAILLFFFMAGLLAYNL